MKKILTVIGMAVLGVAIVYINIAIINMTFDISKYQESTRAALSIWGTFIGFVGGLFRMVN